VRGKGLLQSQLSGFHAGHDLLQLGEGGFEAPRLFGLGGFGHGGEVGPERCSGNGKIAIEERAVKWEKPLVPPGKRSRIAPILRFTVFQKEPSAVCPTCPVREDSKPNASQLPFPGTSDPQVFEWSKAACFAKQPGICRTRADGAEPGTITPSLDGSRQGAGPKRERHRAPVERLRTAVDLLEGRGNAQNIVCPLHRWDLRHEGELLGRPHFPGTLPQPRQDLLQNWRGMLLRENATRGEDLAGFASADDFDFSGYMLDRVEIMGLTRTGKPSSRCTSRLSRDSYTPDWGNFVTCDDLKWHCGYLSAQVVGVKDGFAKTGSRLTPSGTGFHPLHGGKPAKRKV